MKLKCSLEIVKRHKNMDTEKEDPTHGILLGILLLCLPAFHWVKRANVRHVPWFALPWSSTLECLNCEASTVQSGWWEPQQPGELVFHSWLTQQEARWWVSEKARGLPRGWREPKQTWRRQASIESYLRMEHAGMLGCILSSEKIWVCNGYQSMDTEWQDGVYNPTPGGGGWFSGTVSHFGTISWPGSCKGVRSITNSCAIFRGSAYLPFLSPSQIDLPSLGCWGQGSFRGWECCLDTGYFSLWLLSVLENPCLGEIPF